MRYLLQFEIRISQRQREKQKSEVTQRADTGWYVSVRRSRLIGQVQLSTARESPHDRPWLEPDGLDVDNNRVSQGKHIPS